MITRLLWAVASFSFASACFAQTKSNQVCLSYEPAVVRVNGTLIRKTFPGPPNYESVRRGDKPETYWVLDLPRPVCVDQDQRSPDLNPAHKKVSQIQLVLPPDAYRKYKELIGKQVVATGTLFGRHTGHHHTLVLLTVSVLGLITLRNTSEAKGNTSISL